MRKYNLIKKLIFYLSLIPSIALSQQYINWNQNGGGLTGTFNGGSVNVFNGDIGTPININTPAPSASLVNLDTNILGETFRTIGPNALGNSMDLIFNFTVPVIITRYNMADIDERLPNGWNDSFNFLNATFLNFNGVLCAPFATGVSTFGFGNNMNGSASWFCSGMLQNFSLDYLTDLNNLTHFELYYSVQVLVPPHIHPLCVNSNPEPLPSTIGNGLVGSWSPNTIDTSQVGSFQYTFTPDTNQVVQCPVTIDVNIINCPCPPTAELESPDDDVNNNFADNIKHIERELWIKASNFIQVGNNDFEDGVVYHAGNFVELIPGFETEIGAQFAAYPLECTNTFVYKNNPKQIKDLIKNDVFVNQIEHKLMYLSPNPFKDILKISMTDNHLSHLKIISIDGKTIYSNNFDNLQFVEIDLSSLTSGVYIVQALTSYGDNLTEKIIKN